MIKRTKKSGAKSSGGQSGATGKFSVENADAFQVVDEIVSLREALSSMEKSPLSAAARAPAALRRLLEVIENINLRLAELESD